LKLQEIAERLGCALEGDGTIEITRVARIEEAGPGDLTFFANPKYASELRATRASAVIVGERAEGARCAVLRTREPYVAFGRAVALFAPKEPARSGIHARACVAPSAVVAPDAWVGALTVVEEGARIGARTIIHPNVTIGRDSIIGDDCVVHSGVSIRERVKLGSRVVVQNGAVIGSDGFGFARRADGTHEKIPQVGDVVVEDDVEIGANSAIDRPAIGETRIGAGTKIDNLVQIAHGVSIGKRTLLAGQVGIAGSTIVEDDVTLAGQVGVSGHITIGKGVMATAQTGIPNSVEPGAFISGYPAIPNRDWLKASAVFRKLPELRKDLADLQRRLARLEDESSDG
jgi:UDP-3-O-[3-hydroxymyristoyl] glucosamine N-acyltransferase